MQDADGHRENIQGQHRSGNGLIQSVLTQVDILEDEPNRLRKDIARYQKDVTELDGFVKQPFAREQELQTAQKRLGEIMQTIADRQKPKEGEKEGSLAKDMEPQYVGTPPQRAVGKQSIREMLLDPNNGLSDEARRVAAKAMEIPGLDWDNMAVDLILPNGKYQGASYVKQMLLQLTRNARPEALPHEVLHFLWYLLPKEYRDAIEASRVEAIKKMFGEDAPAQLLSGKMTSDQFGDAEWATPEMKKDAELLRNDQSA